MAEDGAAEDRGFAQVVAALHAQNARTREQFEQTRLVADRLWELWAGEAAALLGAEWELADGRTRALLDEELAILALLPQQELPPFQADEPQGAAKSEAWEEAELFELMEHAAASFQAQQKELEAALAARDELIGQVEPHTGAEDSGYAAEHRLWLKRAQDVTERLSTLSAGVRAAREAYVKANQLNTRMFRADLFAEHSFAETGAEQPTEAEADLGFYGQLSPAGLYTLADMLVAAAERLLKALIAAGAALAESGPLVRARQWGRVEQDWIKEYDQRSLAVFLLAGDCLRAMSLLTRSIRQAGRHWEITEWTAGGGRGVLPDAIKVKEVVEMRIAPPPSALAQSGGAPEPDALQKAEAVWRALAGEVDALDKAVVAASGFDSAEGEALEASISQIAARLYAVQDGATEIADRCAELHAERQLPWWRRGRF